MSLADNLKDVLGRIEEAAESAGRRPSDVRLVAVSKTKPAQAVLEALEAGQTIFGENYIQESQVKIPQVGPHIETAPFWHMIGNLQSNKAKLAVQLFDVVQTVDRVKIAKALSRHAEEQGKTLGVLLQVNVGQEPQKSGCSEEDAPAMAQAVAGLPGLKLMGLMTMPPFFDDPERARPHFALLRELAQRMAADLPDGSMDELSMGMSGDFEAAIAEGATLVRVGTAIFGGRY
jgi:pyridoxal phosphate enzyme (YggS family)